VDEERRGEKKLVTTFPERVRAMSHIILDVSTDILTIDNDSLEKQLIPSLRSFQEQIKSGSIPSKDVCELSPENELGFRLFLDTINFCYQDPVSGQEYVYKDKGEKPIRRTYGLMTAMKESRINWGDTSEVSKLTPQKWSEIVQLRENDKFYLGEERGKRISRFATQLSQKGFENISQFISFNGYDSNKILGGLMESGFFDDEFLKRAQLAVRDLDTVLKERFDAKINGTEKLTVMADYRLPQLMYNTGTITLLSDSFVGRLLNRDIIRSGSREELALRAATIVVGEKISKLMGITEADVDLLLWMLAVKMGKSNEMLIPHMLVPTDKY
jgi:hypothetical protein